ncbi:MAG: hypothetical protein HY905_13620 [Deltaproteobacteria bacterium]|nr:hypothetical protein [Deltaproteobacteria bacterium]
MRWRFGNARRVVIVAAAFAVAPFAFRYCPEGAAAASPAAPMYASGETGASQLVTIEEALAPHGSWHEVAEAGSVWRPDDSVVGTDFVPYLSGGRWVETPLGRQFESAWSWGRIVFHYGSWFRDPSLGWVWKPGSRWAAAWVDWRTSDDVVGWAPVRPAALACKVAETWAFARRQDLGREDLAQHILGHDEAIDALARVPLGLRMDQGARACGAAAVDEPWVLIRTDDEPAATPREKSALRLVLPPAAETERVSPERVIIREAAAIPDRSQQPTPVPAVRDAPGATTLPEHRALPDEPMGSAHVRPEPIAATRDAPRATELPPHRTVPRERLPTPGRE